MVIRMSSQTFLKFDYLTLVPMCRKLVNVSLLSPFERQWVDSYHLRAWEELKDEPLGRKLFSTRQIFGFLTLGYEQENLLLRDKLLSSSDPHSTHYSDIVSDMHVPSGSMYVYIYIHSYSDIRSGIYSDILC